jgi:hypothetical protein
METWKLLAIEKLGGRYERVTVPIMYAGILAIWQPEEFRWLESQIARMPECQSRKLAF